MGFCYFLQTGCIKPLIAQKGFTLSAHRLGRSERAASPESGAARIYSVRVMGKKSHDKRLRMVYNKAQEWNAAEEDILFSGGKTQ